MQQGRVDRKVALCSFKVRSQACAGNLLVLADPQLNQHRKQEHSVKSILPMQKLVTMQSVVNVRLSAAKLHPLCCLIWGPKQLPILFLGFLIIPSVTLFTRTSHYVLEAFRIGICECFGIQGLKMPARAGFSDFHGLGLGRMGGWGYFRQVDCYNSTATTRLRLLLLLLLLLLLHRITTTIARAPLASVLLLHLLIVIDLTQVRTSPCRLTCVHIYICTCMHYSCI